MSGFDSQTTGKIITSLFSNTGYFRTARISVILATHSRMSNIFHSNVDCTDLRSVERILPYMDSVVVLDNGRIADVDSYEHVKLRSATLINTATVDQDSEHIEEDEPKSDEATSPVNEDQEIALEKDSLRRRTGSWSVYSYYCRSAGVWSLILWVIFTFIGAFTASYTGELLVKLLLVGQRAHSLHSNMDSTVDRGKRGTPQ